MDASTALDDKPEAAREDEAPPSPWAELFTEAHARHGVFHLRRCADVGLSRHTVSNRARREGWERPHPAVLYLPGSIDGWWRTTSGRLEAVGSDAALGLRSAAHAHAMLRKEPALTEVVRQTGRYRPDRPMIAVRLSRTLDESDIAVVNGLRCTTPQRTLRDLAHVLEVEALRAIAIDGCREEVLDLDLLAGELAAMQPGSPRQRLAAVHADLCRVRTESPFAYDVLEAIADAGYAVEGEFPWRCPDGRVIHHDGAIPAAWVSIECDGRGKYMSGGSFTTDRVRWTQTSGRWRTVWVSWDRWQAQRQAVLDDVRRAVAEADPSAPPPERADCRCRRCRRWAGRGGGR